MLQTVSQILLTKPMFILQTSILILFSLREALLLLDFPMLSVSRPCGVRSMVKQLMMMKQKGLGRNSRGVIGVISRYMPGETEEN
jgi:hypothetical protein